MKSKDKKTCPVCDAVVDVSTRKCPSCDTDLTLFDIDMDGELDVDKITIGDDKSIDDILSSIVGKDESSKLLEDIKTIGEDSEMDATATEAKEVEASEAAEAEEAGVFECPSCGAEVGVDQATCPNCGVEFEGEGVEEFECPICNSPVSADADSCPNCGVRFEAGEEEEAAPEPEVPPEGRPEVSPEPKPEDAPEVKPEVAPPPEPPEEEPPPAPVEEPVPTLSERLLAEREERIKKQPLETYEGQNLYKVLPTLVNQIKPMLAIAKKHGIDIGRSKEMISSAVAANKARDMEGAVRIIQQAKRTLSDSFTKEIANDVEDFVEDVKEAKKVGCDVAGSEELVREAITALRDEDYEVAISDLEAAMKDLDRTAGNYRQASQSLEEASQLAKDAGALGIDIKEAVGLIAEGKEALNRKGWETAILFAKRSTEGLAKALPEVLLEEMKKAKDSLLELKMKGGDLRRAMGIYKQASLSMQKGDYSGVLSHLRVFKQEVSS
ncbi:MAG: zinc ribbon domain-containing protein [Thermoplasmata archaeon]